MNDRELKETGLPCFTPQAVRPSMFRLPVAPACNMRCIGCSRRSNTLRGLAGHGAALLPDEAVDKVASAAEREAPLSGVVVWGPGEPLANASTFVVLKKLSWLYPDLAVTVGTNGLLLPDRIAELVRSGVRSIALSVNAASVGTAERLYDWVLYRGRRYIGEDAARLVLQQQWNGLENAVESGLSVTVSTANMAGVNDHEVADIKRRAEAVGAGRVVVHHYTE
ncbi:MAG: radical SAM protein [Nitrospirota bacterium]